MTDVINYLRRMGYISEQPEIGLYQVRFKIQNLQAVLSILDGCNYNFHHESTRTGYISKKLAGYIEIYSGRFGRGFVLEFPAQIGTRYYPIKYYIHS